MGNKITVTTIVLKDNFSAVKDALKKDALEKAAMAAGQVVEAHAKINANRVFSSKSTGGAGLAGSIQTVLSYSDDNRAEVDIGPTVIYGRAQELGAVIRPVFKKFLHFFVDGQEVFTKMVHLLPHPYLRPAVDENLDEIRDAAGFQIKKAIEESLK